MIEKPRPNRPWLCFLESLPVAHRLRIEKSFAFQKADNGLRCNTGALQPIELGVALSGR
jgi:hypothetical protein